MLSSRTRSISLATGRGWIFTLVKKIWDVFFREDILFMDQMEGQVQGHT
jgi:hypothetical protein